MNQEAPTSGTLMGSSSQGELFAPEGAAPQRRVVLASDPLAVAGRLVQGRTLLTPNERAARAVSRGRSGAVSLSRRATRLLRSSGSSVAGPLARLLALRVAVTRAGTSADVRGTARRLEPVVNELLRAGLVARPGLLEAVLSDASLAPRTAEVARIAAVYSEELGGLGAVDPAEVLWCAAASVRATEPLLVYGYSRLGAGELEFVDALAGPRSVIVLPLGFRASEDAAAALAALGWSVEDDAVPADGIGPWLAARFVAGAGGGSVVGRAPAADGVPAGAAGAYRLASEEDEVRWALARVKRLLGTGVQPAEIVLVARDERAYGPLVRAVGAEFGVPVRLAYQVPLSDTRLGEAVAGIVSVVGRRLPFEETARLLRHPLVVALTEEAWVTARAWHPEGPQEWRNAGAEVAELLAWPAKATWDEYVGTLEATLSGLGISERAKGRDGRARDKLRSSLREVAPAGAPGRTTEPMTLPEFLARLGDVLDTVLVPVDPPDRQTVELHTPLAVFGARYRHVIALGLTEGTFPQAIREDPVIDLPERIALARTGVLLEDAEGAAEREELSFLAVLHAAGESLTLTSPETAGGTEQVPSPYLPAAGLQLEPAGPRSPASSLERLIVDLPTTAGPAKRAWSVERRREGPLGPDAYDGLPGVPLPLGGPYSATQLTTYGQCGFRWFAQYGLRLSEVVEAEEEVSALTLGSVFHDTLAMAVRRAALGAGQASSPAEEDPLRAAVVSELDRAYDDVHEEREKRGERIRSKTWPRQRAENIEKLRRLVMSEDFMLPGARVTHVEERFEGTWRGLDVRGFVDRIDGLTGDHGRTLVFTDYKLGKTPPKGAKGPKGTLNLDVQLPLYIEAAAPALDPDATVGAARYLSINGAAISRQVDPAKVDSASLDGLVVRFREALATGEFPLDPDPRQEACEYCPFDAVCRRGPRLSRKAARAAAQDQEEAA